MNTSISVILAVAIITAFMGASVPIEQAFASSAASAAAGSGSAAAAAAAGDSSSGSCGSK